MTTLDPSRTGAQPGTAALRPDHTVVDLDRLEATRPDGTRLEGTRPEIGQSDAHLLRLCLDLQLDALMLTLGAASLHSDSRMSLTTGDVTVDRPLPWRRWLGEDVDLACTLAADALGGGAALPPTLGTELDQAVPATTIDTLTALYESMRDRLQDLLERTPTDPWAAPAHDWPADTWPPQAWHPRLREALHRAELRLAELRDYRLTATPARGISLREEHQYLPGELLG